MMHGYEGGMVGFEWLAVAYFAGLALTAPFTRAPWRRRLGVVAAAATAAALVSLIATLELSGLRIWLPHAYLLAGYWLPALLVEPPLTASAFERWLCRTDAVLRPRLPVLPEPAIPVVELAYLACYPMVPFAVLVVQASGSPEAVNRFWLAVLASGYACYGSLPWLVSRPPRLAQPQTPAARQGLGALNVLVLGRVSHRLNTFPSGHVAVSCATAALVAVVSPPAGMMLGMVAVAIAVGAAVGRYHYVVDVLLGIGVAGAASALALRF